MARSRLFHTPKQSSRRRAINPPVRTASLALALVLLLPSAASPTYDKDYDWKNRKHRLRVCLKPRDCPAGWADSIRTAIDIWNSDSLTWRFTWADTACDSADIIIKCQKFITGGAVTNAFFNSSENTRATITLDPTEEWGYCDNKVEIVSTVLHELGHCARLEETPSADQSRIMRWRQKKPGHLRELSAADSMEAAMSDTARPVTTTTTPRGGKRQEIYHGVITPSAGSPPFDFARALGINLVAFQPQAMQILSYLPQGSDALSWSAIPTAEAPDMQLFFLTIAYRDSIAVREGVLHVTGVDWQPGWQPNCIAPPDTTVPNDTSQVVLYTTLCGHPAGAFEDVAWVEWIVDDSTGFKGDPEFSVTLPAGNHVVRLVATDHFGMTDEDTMRVTVLGTVTGVGRPGEPGSSGGTVGPPGESSEPLLAIASPARRTEPLRIDYTLPRPARVTIAMYDVQGRNVRTLIAQEKADAGPHSTTWDFADGRGRRAGPGIYFCQLRTDDSSVTCRVVVAR